MSRIDVQTLVLALEKRIEALDKNPENLVPQEIINNLLEKAINDVIRENFINVAKREIRELVKNNLRQEKNQFVKTAVKNILTDSSFRVSLEKKIKTYIIDSIRWSR
jgi:AAA+ superfamily predicted ATPase